MKVGGLFGALVRDAEGNQSLPWGFGSSVPSATGIQISTQTALQVTTVMACTSVLAEDTSKMAPRLYREIEAHGYLNGKRQYLTAKDHYLVRLFDKPNDWMTWPEFVQMMMIGIVLRGNGFAVIVRDRNGFPLFLVPINPDRVSLYEAPNGMLFWMVSRAGYHEMQVLAKTPLLIPYDDVLHIKGLSVNGLRGLSRIAVNREAVALALAQEQQYARLMGNGARPAGILSTEQKLSPEAAQKLVNDWNTTHGALINSGKTAVLEHGLKWEQITLSAVDLQFLQLRGFQVQEIARMFRVPPHMVGDLSRSTNNNIVQQSQDYRNNTLMTYSLLWESRMAFTFDLADDPKGPIKCEFDPAPLLKADITTRYGAYRVGILTGFLKPNEARVAEGLEADENGNTLLQPTSMAPMGTLPGEGTNAHGGGAAGEGGQGSDTTGQAPDGAGKPTEDVTASSGASDE